MYLKKLLDKIGLDLTPSQADESLDLTFTHEFQFILNIYF